MDDAYTLSARKEIVLSVGPFQSPWLLMVSGVGPAATLKTNGIPLVADRPGVGQNMQEHIIYASSYRPCAPRSRGNVTLASPRAGVLPVINPNWLTDPPILIGPEYFPRSQVATDAEILDHVRKSFDTILHASCTCAMGLANDTQAVVDSKALVIVDALRVVDASALPFLPPGHPQSTLYALAEKIACEISGNC
ncbi:Glucose-methanol-choline oxidoreductase C-terminal [Penicillium cf. viridicatum]|uniref:Glucose-methanol-choline oxidoreductase C-terminal n=1 Tax=Penicillium cf. viridicatum TaxID=2972119 RepID=A0A9W9MK72_9EURO|nr:Glucose-methanol-choline oxidoreductase C-terminal [Penicillium cf. viridicatum]